jgi:selenocysteine-specific elongation factor
VTIAGGEVLDPAPDRGPIRTAAARARFASLDPSPGAAGDVPATDRAVAAVLSSRGAAGLPLSALVSRLGVAPSELDDVVRRQTTAGPARRVADGLVSTAVLEELVGRVLAVLAEHHRQNPLLEGMPREEVRERLFARAGQGVFEHVVERLQGGGAVSGRDRLALATHHVSLSAEEDEAQRAVLSAYEAGGLKPPELDQVAAASGLDAATLDRVVKLMLRQKVLVRVGTLVFHEAALRNLRDDMRKMKSSVQAGGLKIDVGTFKERYGVTRKYAIPLLEYLDRERVTRRVGESRVLI